jgi:predicted transcriptional regulator
MAMQKTTVYIPDELKAALERTARATRRSEAELIREGIRLVTEEHSSPLPTLPL